MSDGIKATMRLSAEQVVALGRALQAMEADRDEWRALAQEFGGVLDALCDEVVALGGNPLGNYHEARIALAVLREKEERDAGTS